GIGMRRHQPARLVIEEEPGALTRRQRLAVDRDHVIGGHIQRRRIDDPAVDGNTSLHDPLFGVAARGETGARQYLGDALTGLLGLCLFARRASVEIDLAFPIGAAAAEGRTFRKTLVLLFVVPALPLEMRPVEFGAIITFTLIATAPEAGTLLAAAILTRAAVLIAALAISSRTRGKAFAMLVLLATLPLETGAAEFGAVFVSTRL